MLKFVRRFKSTTTLVRSDVPANLTKVASANKHIYEIQEYQTKSLQQYFQEDALLFPVETIIEKCQAKDYRFFLQQRNFLKVVDTLEKFEQGMLDRESSKAREFILFKKQLYSMYEIQNRSVHEHELYSFNIERKNLKSVYLANESFQQELMQIDAEDQIRDNTRLKGAIYKRKALDPTRVKGLGALAASYGLYSYLPYLAVYVGSTIPVLSACAAGIYGLMAFSETNSINVIDIVKEGEHQGKLKLNVGVTAFSSKDIIVDVKEIKSVIALDNDNLGEDDFDGNAILIKSHFDVASNKQIDEDIVLGLPADAHRNKVFLDWIIAEKDNEGDLADDYNNLLTERFLQNKSIQQNALAILSPVGLEVTPLNNDDIIDYKMDTNAPIIDEKLEKLQNIYGKEFLMSLEDTQLYKLYRQHF